MKKFVAIVPAAGNSSRFSGEVPKQFLKVGGRTILELSAVGLGFYLGGIVGIGTILYALGIGFSVSLGLFFVGKFYK